MEDFQRTIDELDIDSASRKRAEAELEARLAQIEAEIKRLRELIATHKRHIQTLELQEAKFGLHVPTYIVIEIADLKHKVAEYEQLIREQVSAGLDFLQEKLASLTNMAEKLNIQLGEMKRMLLEMENQTALACQRVGVLLSDHIKNGCELLVEVEKEKILLIDRNESDEFLEIKEVLLNLSNLAQEIDNFVYPEYALEFDIEHTSSLMKKVQTKIKYLEEL